MKIRSLVLSACVVALACDDARAVKVNGDSARAVAAASSAAKLRADSARADSIHRAKIAHVPRPEIVRGLYINRWAALGQKMRELIGVAKTTEVNALVIDVKDDRGFVLYKSKVPLAIAIGADTNRAMSHEKLRSILDTMIAHKIYPIARIVVAKDPLLAGSRLEWAIKRKDNLEPWMDKNGHPWLDPHHREVWQYAADLAKEAYDLGFSEVQFDYVRFPDEKRLVHEAVYPLANGRVRAQVIRDQIGFVREALKPLGMPVTIDVFGLTATDTTDMGIGQRWEMFADQADVVLPMVYPSHFAPGTYKLGNPNASPYATIDHAMKDIKRRNAKIANVAKVVPWYQDFTLGPPHYYREQVRAQMKAGYDNGFQSWILWNPGSRYTLAALEPES
ncbi:MAG TPA: putative glycoside hydrolase [Gemmatimonadaceae bacterium]|nr:putative glycoside hydrolase [Gemmatimonadaceae bacterium]